MDDSFNKLNNGLFLLSSKITKTKFLWTTKQALVATCWPVAINKETNFYERSNLHKTNFQLEPRPVESSSGEAD